MPRPAALSALLALQLSGITAPPATATERDDTPSRLNVWLHNEAQKRGRVWMVLGAILGLLLAALGVWATIW
jgi:hypothetical protein